MVEHLPMFTKVESMFAVHEILCLSLQVVIQIIFVDILDFMQLPCTIFCSTPFIYLSYDYHVNFFIYEGQWSINKNVLL
jgi:hypothetical protein